MRFFFFISLNPVFKETRHRPRSTVHFVRARARACSRHGQVLLFRVTTGVDRRLCGRTNARPRFVRRDTRHGRAATWRVPRTTAVPWSTIGSVSFFRRAGDLRVWRGTDSSSRRRPLHIRLLRYASPNILPYRPTPLNAYVRYVSYAHVYV